MTGDDPILARRARVAALTALAQRTGYLLYGAALIGFFYGLGAGFGRGVAIFVVATLVAGSVLLAPAIIVGYAVRAADRADRNGEW